jgi:hypothetical protein
VINQNELWWVKEQREQKGEASNVKVSDTKVFTKILDDISVFARADGDVGKEGEVLDETNRASLRCLSRTDDAPLGVVELTWAGKLTIS